MNGNRTEKPTPKKIKDSRRKGKVARSSDLSGAVVFLVLIMIIFLTSEACLDVWCRFLHTIWSEPVLLAESLDLEVFIKILKGFIRLLAVFLVPAAIIGGLAGFLQVGPLFVPVKADLSRINLSSGIKNLFSAKKYVDLLKMLLKFLAVALPCLLFCKRFFRNISMLSGCRPGFVFEIAGKLTADIFFWAAGLFAVFGVVDYWIQYRRWYKDLMMKRHDVQKEVKDSEGDADIKNMRRQMHKEIVSYGLSERVAAAQIVVVNPTTFAVALEYREATGSAPRVIAKGAYESAAEIRRLAAKFNVPVVRHPPLARQLFLLMIEEEIPMELFRAVAELLVYVIRLTESERKRYC